MRAWVITIPRHEYSDSMARRCISSAAKYGIQVEKFYGVTPDTVQDLLDQFDLYWTWANNNQSRSVCPKTGLTLTPYRARDVRTKIACSMSHYLLWRQCADTDEPMLILEHDAVFIGEMPDIEFEGAIQINDPRGGGYRGQWHSDQIIARGIPGVHPLIRKREIGSTIPDGFSGNSAYIIKPWAARKFVAAFHDLGVWPNDATICLQLFPWLQEYYPFVTQVEQTRSTTTE